MATVAPGDDPDISLTYAKPVVSGDLFAGEDLNAGHLIRVSNGTPSGEEAGKVYHCQPDDGAGSPAADSRGRVIGVAPRNVKSGQPVTPFGPGTHVQWGGGGLTAGELYYVGSDGQIDDSPQQNDQEGVAYAINSDEFILVRQAPATA